MEVIDDSLKSVNVLNKVLKKSKSSQVRNNEEKTLIKSTSYAWFNTNKSILANNPTLKNIDQIYTELLELSEKNTTRVKYLHKLKNLKDALILLRSENLLIPPIVGLNEKPPLFHSLIKDPNMQAILLNRWEECNRCIKADAPLSAVVMMGGILEAILLARD